MSALVRSGTPICGLRRKRDAHSIETAPRAARRMRGPLAESRQLPALIEAQMGERVGHGVLQANT